MKAMSLQQVSRVEDEPLEIVDMDVPRPGQNQLLIKIAACGVCHTDVDEVEGRVQTKLPVIPGHQIVGTVAATGPGVTKFRRGERVGAGWIWSSCGHCEQCSRADENLCADFLATGSDVDGGYAKFTVVPEAFGYPIPKLFSDAQAAPLLCAGAVGYRALRLAGVGPDQRLGLYGFGASAHIVIQVAIYQGSRVYAFSRSEKHRALAKKLGAVWVGRPDQRPAQSLHAAIDFTPVGETVPKALELLEKGGRLVIAAIRKQTPISELDYTKHLWQEKELKSVANVTREDISGLLALAAEIPIIPEIQEFPLKEANKALGLLKQGKIQGAAVLKVD